MEFYETNEFGGQTDNWVGPSLPCLLAFCRTAGFARVELKGLLDWGACLACYRKWQAPSANAGKAPELVRAAHNTNDGINFDSHHDESVSVWFTCREDKLGLDDVKPEVSGYGVRPFHLARIGDGSWQSNFKLPPGLTAGWHDVRVRVQDTLPSNGKKIAVDIPLPESPIRITGACDGKTWTRDQLDKGQGDTLSLWIEGLPENADANNLRVLLDGHRLRIMHIEAPSPEPRQVNARIPVNVQPGTNSLEAALGNQRTRPVQVRIVD